MTMEKWSSFPRWWIDDRLSKFTGGLDAGVHMAALRVYLGITLHSDFNTRLGAPTWDLLGEVTGLSRPMIGKGLLALATKGILEIDSSSYRHQYKLVSLSEAPGFVKVPRNRLRKELAKMPTRGAHALDCLKLYLALLRLRQRNSFQVPISHRKIVDWTGIKPNRIRAAIDVLINHGLIHVTIAESSSLGHPHNVYQLLGFLDHRADANKPEEGLVVKVPPAEMFKHMAAELA